MKKPQVIKDQRHLNLKLNVYNDAKQSYNQQRIRS